MEGGNAQETDPRDTLSVYTNHTPWARVPTIERRINQCVSES